MSPAVTAAGNVRTRLGQADNTRTWLSWFTEFEEGMRAEESPVPGAGSVGAGPLCGERSV
ncbi:hypothetical protein EYD13_10910 [Saccharomonospora xinjiangensis]|nr:hypothetical protein EYD13_10910 [Saccharomonospora xinjiangensis]